ncbi:MAG TPA: hypothetical protein VMT62_08615 [Syntrophorhabdaceae bacterium]|nr:hypothetical protein [Syntrophorhabdaceae bacterium]
MRFLKYLYSNVHLLNILLMAGLLFLVFFVVLPLFSMNVRYTPPRPQTKATAEEQGLNDKAPPASAADFTTVAENNLFHPDRVIPPEKKDEQAFPKPDLVLYGTVVTNGVSLAYIEDKKSPQTTPGRGKRQTVVKRGDTVSGFVVREIGSDRIVLTRGDETMVVQLSVEGKQRGDTGSTTSAISTTMRPSGSAATTTTSQATSVPSAASPFTQSMPTPSQSGAQQASPQMQRNPSRGPRGLIPPAADQAY